MFVISLSWMLTLSKPLFKFKPFWWIYFSCAQSVCLLRFFNSLYPKKPPSDELAQLIGGQVSVPHPSVQIPHASSYKALSDSPPCHFLTQIECHSVEHELASWVVSQRKDDTIQKLKKSRSMKWSLTTEKWWMKEAQIDAFLSLFLSYSSLWFAFSS